MDRYDAFRGLHEGPAILVLPNAWDVASARVFEEAGFPAIATSSAGVANALGAPDGEALDPDLHLATIERIARALNVPLTADVESGYGDDARAVGAFIGKLARTGAVGFNLEDARHKREGELYDVAEQCERIRAARGAAPRLFVNARTDIYLAQIGPEETRFERTMERLRAYAEAGADGVFVPGVADAETIRRIAATSPRPLNVLAGPAVPDAPTLQSLGVRRVSVGSWPMRRTLGVLREIAQELRGPGSFSFTRSGTVSYDEANALAGRRT